MMCIGHIRTAQTIQGISAIENNTENNNTDDDDEDSSNSDQHMRNATPAD